MADAVFVREFELAGKLICSSPLGRAGGAAEERSDEAAEPGKALVYLFPSPTYLFATTFYLFDTTMMKFSLTLMFFPITLGKSVGKFVQSSAAKIESGREKIESGAKFHHCERKIDHSGDEKVDSDAV